MTRKRTPSPLKYVRRARNLAANLLLLLAPYASAAESDNPALQALFDQANYWHQKAHSELAQAALKKILMIDATNSQALYLMSLWAQQRGDTAVARDWYNRLSQASPNDPRLTELNNVQQLQAIPQQQLALARQQARSGNITAALGTWRNIFSGEDPPPAVAAEYYLTMAGDHALLPQAVDKLRQFTQQHPQDNTARLALGKVLTYQESTRREGIALLASLANNNAEADSALGQALLWQTPQPSDAALYQAWQQRHPQDQRVMDYFKKNSGGIAKSSGFNALNSGDLATAQSAFTSVLNANPQDADALAGLGYVAQRSGNFQQAATYLQRAAQLGGAQGQARQQQASDAQFYAKLAEAQQALKQGQPDKALTLSQPLAQQPGDKGVVAGLFRADVLRQSKQLAQSEQAYRAILQSNPDNEKAKEGLFYLLRQQNRTREANALLASLPAAVRASVTPRADADQLIRKRAAEALAAGDNGGARSLLQQGVARYPHDGWLRLDLARLYRSENNSAAAIEVMQPATRPNASDSELYAAAIDASERNSWAEANQLLTRIPLNHRSSDMRTLAKRVNFNTQMLAADRWLDQGDQAAAVNTLRALVSTPPSNPVDAGNLAQKLVAAGDIASAVAVVRTNLRLGVQDNAGAYATQMAVLGQAGLDNEAQAFLSNPLLQARSTPSELANIQNGYVINQVDRLREEKQYAVAYDKLITALQRDPQNRDLLLAMARLYQTGKMNREAGEVYDYLLARDNPQQDARVGAINVALAEQNVAQASTLAAGLRSSDQPERLLLLARIAQAQGESDQALGYLRSARGKLLGLQGAQAGTAPTLGGLALADNPFINRGTPSFLQRSASVYGSVMPWQKTDALNDSTATASNRAAAQQRQTLQQIDTLLAELQQDTDSWLQVTTDVRGRDGEAGLSQLIEAKMPLTWSLVPFERARLSFNLTPVTLSAGSASGDAWRRFGSNALLQAQSVAQGSATIDDVPTQTTDDERTAGIEAGLSLSGDNYKVDIGSTPLGQQLSTLVGGVSWSPKLTDYLTLILTGERRAMTDSMLSYVGVNDAASGQRWGQVTKNGGNALLSYDNGDAGFYIGLGTYSYQGKNVASNRSINGLTGAYLRPFHDDQNELKAGVNVSWMDFSHNLSAYTFGQGGYFSPQNYVSVSLPLDFTSHQGDFSAKLGGALGWQSYTQQKSAWFPSDATMQSQLEADVSRGYANQAWYPGSSQEGIGYNLYAGADYNISQSITVGGQISYDTFGDYNESKAQLWLRYLPGDKR